MGVIFSKGNKGIKSLTIEGVASYVSPVTLHFKKCNFIYGLNGTGKSTISNYLASPNAPEFLSSSIEYFDKRDCPEVFVYNQKFIDDTFGEETQKGIFTITKGNKDAVEKIKDHQKVISELKVSKKALEEKKEALATSIKGLQVKLEEGLWQHKKEYDNSSLKECLHGSVSSKAVFSQAVLKKVPELSCEEPECSFSELEKLMDQLSGDDVEPPEILEELSALQSNLEMLPIWEESIRGADDSYLADVISTLQHQDWVRIGVDDYLDSSDECPFCKQAISDDLKDKIRGHFDEAFEQKKNEVIALKGEYSSFYRSTNVLLESYQSIVALSGEAKVISVIRDLQDALGANVNDIDNKIKLLSKPVTLRDTSKLIKDINDHVSRENERRKTLIRQLQDKRGTKRKVKEDFWTLLAFECKGLVSVHREDEKNKEDEITFIKEEIEKVCSQIHEHEDAIKAAQKETKNVDAAVTWINEQLALLGVAGFYIDKVSSFDIPYYQLCRNSSGERVFRTLSEGEKTLISFLYFLRLCSGGKSSEDVVDISNRVVVIDDPISSLSFNLVHEIACLIHKTFLSDESNFAQVIVLTHHLYFMHELFYLTKGKSDDFGRKDYALYRLLKGTETTVEKLSRGDIKDNYQSYWQAIRDVKAGKMSAAFLPNAMRNILEHYFGFIHQRDNLSKVFEDLKGRNLERSFAVFERYVNKGSHSDSVNITDQSDINVDKFLSYFEEVFTETSFQEHFKVMMEDVDG